MASAGTLLSDLDSKAPVFNSKDDDLVNKILADMNVFHREEYSMGGTKIKTEVVKVVDVVDKNQTFSNIKKNLTLCGNYIFIHHIHHFIFYF